MPALFAVAVIAGATYWPASRLLAPGIVIAAWKGAGVGLLASWAALSAVTRAGRRIAGVLSLGALGDVLLATAGLSVGGVAFLAGHVLATALYGARRRDDSAAWVVGAALLLGVAGSAYALSGQVGVLAYAIGLGAMTGSAWASRFPRAWLGAGAVLFATSDLLIFARIGERALPAGSSVPELLIWPLYFAGQAMIAYGVVTAEDER